MLAKDIFDYNYEIGKNNQNEIYYNFLATVPFIFFNKSTLLAFLFSYCFLIKWMQRMFKLHFSKINVYEGWIFWQLNISIWKLGVDCISKDYCIGRRLQKRCGLEELCLMRNNALTFSKFHLPPICCNGLTQENVNFYSTHCRKYLCTEAYFYALLHICCYELTSLCAFNCIIYMLN